MLHNTGADATLSNVAITNFARHTRTYNPGLSWSGVGHTFVNNDISNGPHAAILGNAAAALLLLSFGWQLPWFYNQQKNKNKKHNVIIVCCLPLMGSPT